MTIASRCASCPLGHWDNPTWRVTAHAVAWAKAVEVVVVLGVVASLKLVVVVRVIGEAAITTLTKAIVVVVEIVDVALNLISRRTRLDLAMERSDVSKSAGQHLAGNV